MRGVEHDDETDGSELLGNSGIVLTARISVANAGDGDVSMVEEIVGTDKVLLLLLLLLMTPTSGVDIVVVGVDDDDRTKDRSFS